MTIPDHLITPRDWSAEALHHAAEWTGQPEGVRALVESRRYLAMHELIERLRELLSHAQAHAQAALDKLEAAQADRLAALARAEQYLAERDAEQAEVARVREVLRGVEWCELPHAYYGVAVRCPHCGGLRSDGHDPECPLSAALAAKGGVR